MALIGMATLSAVATVAFIRSQRAVNKLTVAGIWAATLGYYAGVAPL